jgi:signal transduction histidine kinase
MQIRTRLTLQFLLWGAIIMIIASVTIYYSSASFRKEDFDNRLRNKAKSTARLLLDAKEIDPDRVQKIEKDNPINLYNEKIIILNFLNDVVYSSDPSGEIKIINSILERVRLMERVTYKQGSYQVIGTLYTAKFDRFVVIAAATDTEGPFYLNKLRLILIIVCFSSLILLSIAGWIYSGRALKPITNVVKRVEDISISSLNLRVPALNETDEIGRLAKTFNKMLERLEASFAVQKDFIANASHELRTPLTSINGQLEVLMMKDRSSEEYKAAIESVLEDIKFLINLSNRLLLVARTSSEGYANSNKKVRIDEVLWQVQEETKKYNNEYQINISLGNSLTDSDHLVVLGDESMLKVALSNIIDNACKYSPDHSVDIKIEHSGQNIELVFTDRGIGISESDLQKVFEPFYRAANAIQYTGSGIGLQLVNQIIKNHDGTIKLSSQIGKGTSVIIKLPSIQ